MAHSFDSTLLQRMGFKDPDRGTSAHDDACISIAANPAPFIKCRDWTRNASVALEVLLQKGSGQYATTIGFIDAVVTFESCDEGNGWRRWSHANGCVVCRSQHCQDEDHQAISGPNRPEWNFRSLLIEVKTSIDSIGDLLRQMNLYREYFKPARPCLFDKPDKYIVWSLSDEDSKHRDLLKGQGYELVTGKTPA